MLKKAKESRPINYIPMCIYDMFLIKLHIILSAAQNKIKKSQNPCNFWIFCGRPLYNNNNSSGTSAANPLKTNHNWATTGPLLRYTTSKLTKHTPDVEMHHA